MKVSEAPNEVSGQHAPAKMAERSLVYEADIVTRAKLVWNFVVHFGLIV
jgi:hypothetical protein